MNRDELIDKVLLTWLRSSPDAAADSTFSERVLERNRPRARAVVDAVEHLIRADALTDAAYELDAELAAYELDAELGEPTEPMSLREAVDVTFQNHTRDIVKWLCDRAEDIEEDAE